MRRSPLKAQTLAARTPPDVPVHAQLQHGHEHVMLAPAGATDQSFQRFGLGRQKVQQRSLALLRQVRGCAILAMWCDSHWLWQVVTGGCR